MGEAYNKEEDFELWMSRRHKENLKGNCYVCRRRDYDGNNNAADKTPAGNGVRVFGWVLGRALATYRASNDWIHTNNANAPNNSMSNNTNAPSVLNGNINRNHGNHHKTDPAISTTNNTNNSTNMIRNTSANINQESSKYIMNTSLPRIPETENIVLPAPPTRAAYHQSTTDPPQRQPKRPVAGRSDSISTSASGTPNNCVRRLEPRKMDSAWVNRKNSLKKNENETL